MNWNQQWLEVILILLFGGAPVTWLALAITKWLGTNHRHRKRAKEGKGRSPWRD